MTRWAAVRPTAWKNSPLSISTLALMTILLGCGGGGGGGGPIGGPGPQPCGSAANSVVPVICGNVVDNNTLAGVANSTVKLLTATGAPVLINGNAAVTSTNSAGFYIFSNVPANAALFQVDPPAATYNQGLVGFNGHTYSYTFRDQANVGPCVPAIGVIPAGDKKLSNVRVFNINNPPPPPDSPCPR